MIELTHPYWLLLWLLLPLAAVAGRGPRHGLRVLSLGLLGVALSGFVCDGWLIRRDRGLVVVAYDVSASVGDEAQTLAAAWEKELASRGGGKQFRWMPFAAEPLQPIPRPVPAAEVVAMSASPTDNWPIWGTDIGMALQCGMGHSQAVCELVVISDGHETTGDAVAVAERSTIPISTVAVEPNARPEVQLTTLEPPDIIVAGQRFSLHITSRATVPTTGRLELYESGRLLTTEELSLEPGENRFQLQHTIDHTRITELQVRLVGFADTFAENNTASLLVQCDPKPELIVVDHAEGELESFKQTLEAQGVQISLRKPEGLPDRADDLRELAAVVFSDVAANEFSIPQLEAVRTFVTERGGGLIMLGGERSFGLGGWDASPLGAILPVHGDFDRPEETPRLAMVLAIDRSSSMAGENLQMAKLAATAAAELLGAEDLLGILQFDAAPRWLLEPGPNHSARAAAASMEIVTAAGGTAMLPALEAARQALVATEAQLKHVILLTDGHSAAADWDEQIGRMTADQITVSTVSVGASADQPLLARLATLGQGRHYFCPDPRTIPQVFARETIRASGEAIQEESFRVNRLRPHRALRGVDLASAPSLYGYVRTRPKTTAEQLLVTDTGDPLLLTWRVGRGKVTAFTSDAKPRWAKDWLTWSGYGQFWAQLVRDASRDPRDGESELLLRRAGEYVVAQLDLVDRNHAHVSAAQPALLIRRADGTRQQLAMPLVAPGRYALKIPTPRDEPLHVTAIVAKRGRLSSRSLPSAYPEELRWQPTDRLRDMAAVSGGRFNPAARDFLGPCYGRAPAEIGPWLLWICLLLFGVEIAGRYSHRGGSPPL